MARPDISDYDTSPTVRNPVHSYQANNRSENVETPSPAEPDECEPLSSWLWTIEGVPDVSPRKGIEHDLAVHAQSNNNGAHIITSRGTRKLEPAGKIKGHRWLTVLCLCLMITTSCTDDRELEQIEIDRPPIKISWTNSQYSICRCQQCCKKVENHMKPVNRENTPLDKRRPLMDQEHSSSTDEFYLIVVEEREVKSIAETETVSWHKKIYTYTIKGFMPVLYFFMKSLTSEMGRNQFKNPKISTSTGVAEAGPHRPNWIYILLFCHVFIPAGLYYGFQKEVAHLPDSRSIKSVGYPAIRNGNTDNLVQHASSHLPAGEETPSSKLQKETDSFAEYVPQNVTEPLTRNNPTVSKRISETKPSDITNAIPLESCESLALIKRPVDRNSSTAIGTQDGDHPERNIQGKQEGNVFSQRNNAKNDARCGTVEDRLKSSERTEDKHEHELNKANKNRPTFEHCNASERRSAAEDYQMFPSNKYMEDSSHIRSTFDTFGKNGTQHTEENNDNGSLERPPRNDSTGNTDENDKTEYARTNDNNRIKNTNGTKNTEEIFTTNAASSAQEHSETYADKHSADHPEPDEKEITRRHVKTLEECYKTEEILAIGNTKEISSPSDAITCLLEPLGTAKTKSTAEQEQTKQHSNTFNSVNMEKPFRAANNITETTINRIDNRNNEIFDTQHKVEEISHSSDVAECTDVATRPDDGIYGFNRNGIAFDDNVERITIKTSSNTVRKGNYQGYSPCFDNQQTIENQYHDENESEGDDGDDDDDEDDETMLKTQNTTFPSEGDDHLATAFIYQDDDEHLESVSLVEDGCSRDDADIIFNSSTSSTLNSPSNQTPKEHNICKEPKNSNGPYVSCCFESDEYIPGKVNKMMPEISSGFVSYTNDHLTTATSASANLKVFKGHEISVRLAVSRALKKVITPNNASQFRNRFRRLSPHAQHLDNIRRIREATFITQNLSNLWQQSTTLPGQQHYRDENRTFNRSPRLQTISDERETLGAVGVNGGSALPASTDTKASLDVFAAIGVCSVTESMVYEWGRLKTFFNFPMNNPMMPVTLAKYGFYYTGDSDVVKCFSCNVSHGNWQKGDSVYAVHYQTSPRCRFMNGEDKRNVPVNGDVAASVDKRAGGRDDSLARNTDWAETTPRLSTPATVTSLFLDPKSNITPETDTRGSGGPSSNEETREVDNQYMNQQHPTTLDQRQQLRLEQNGGGQQPLQRQQDQTVVNGAATNFTNTEAAAARPRYPNYSSAAARAGTFNGFPNHLDQTPQFMAKAGFFYAGYGDYVRCFFCGGGLRNWEPGDDPWVEHARWFPRCTHVKQHKGQPFINLVLQRQRELTLPNEYITTRQHASNTDQNVTNQTASVQTHNDRQTGARNSHTSARNQTESKSEPNTTANTQQSRAQGSLVDRDQSAKQSPDPKQTGSNGRKGPSAGTANSSKITNETKNVEHKTSNSQTAQHLNPEPKLRGGSQANSYTDEELKSIQEENAQLKEQMKCKICMDNDVCISFLPCGHLCCCAECAPVMVKCPICRQVISGSMITYLS